MKMVWLVLAIVLSSCSFGPTKSAGPSGLSADDFWREQEIRSKETNLIAGKLRLRYRGKNQSVGGAGRWLLQMPHQARLELRDPLGRLAYLVALEGPQFVAYYPSQKQAFVGGEGGRGYLKKLLGLSARFGDLQRIALGLVPSAVELKQKARWEWDEATGTYRVVFQSKEGEISAFLDPKTAAITEMIAHLGNETVRVVYSDFDDCCRPMGVGRRETVSFGNSVRIYMERAQTQVEVDWEELSPLDKPRGKEAFMVELPKDVRRINVGN